jgi:hypothetical protein
VPLVFENGAPGKFSVRENFRNLAVKIAQRLRFFQLQGIVGPHGIGKIDFCFLGTP